MLGITQRLSRVGRTTRVQRRPLSADIAQTIRSGGGEPMGLQPGYRQAPALAYFHDPDTRTTLAIPVADVTTDAVKSHLKESRKLFRDIHVGVQELNAEASTGNRLTLVIGQSRNRSQSC